MLSTVPSFTPLSDAIITTVLPSQEQVIASASPLAPSTGVGLEFVHIDAPSGTDILTRISFWNFNSTHPSPGTQDRNVEYISAIENPEALPLALCMGDSSCLKKRINFLRLSMFG